LLLKKKLINSNLRGNKLGELVSQLQVHIDYKIKIIWMMI